MNYRAAAERRGEIHKIPTLIPPGRDGPGRTWHIAGHEPVPTWAGKGVGGREVAGVPAGADGGARKVGASRSTNGPPIVPSK